MNNAKLQDAEVAQAMAEQAETFGEQRDSFHCTG